MKAQIGVEYLVIYAIALVILLIVVGLVLQMFTSASYTPRCTSDIPMMICKDGVFALTKNPNGNNLVAGARLLNGNQKDIQVLAAACYTGKMAPSGLRYTSLNNIVIKAQDARDITNIPCVDGSNNQVIFSSGAGFDGTLEIIYRFTDDIVQNRTLRLYLTGKMG